MRIRVNTICPGIFPSEMTAESAGGHEYKNLNVPATKAAIRSTAGEWSQPFGVIVLVSS